MQKIILDKDEWLAAYKQEMNSSENITFIRVIKNLEVSEKSRFIRLKVVTKNESNQNLLINRVQILDRGDIHKECEKL